MSTIGNNFFGLDPEGHARSVEGIYRDLEPIREMGAIPSGVTYYDVADAVVDTIAGITSGSDIGPDDLAGLLRDALDQVGEGDATEDGE